ncbi:hypothetical protein PTI98_007991 [Pleurotus ostreatus]|nr:hypothetical protein PTI98_007991 [Pleurotus ostreatus]
MYARNRGSNLPPSVPSTPLDKASQVENQVAAQLAKQSGRKRRCAHRSHTNKENSDPSTDGEASDSEKEQTYQAYG